MKEKIIGIALMAVIFASACVSQQEIKLNTDCSAEDVLEKCKAACQGNFSAELDAWRCSVAGQPVCVCKAYKESGEYIG